MPTVEAFSNWARSVGGDLTLAAIKDAPNGQSSVVDLSKVKNPLARLIGTRDTLRRRDAACMAFKRALTEKYGETIGTFAFSKASSSGPSHYKGLAAYKVIAAIEIAERLAVQHKALTAGGHLSAKPLLSGEAPSGAVIHDKVLGEMSPENHKLVRDLLVAITNANQLLGMTPAGQGEMTSFRSRCSKVSARLKEFAKGADKLTKPELAEGLRQALSGLVGKITDRLTVAESFASHAPGGEESLRALAGQWKNAFIQAAEKRAAAAKDMPEGVRQAAEAALADIWSLGDAFFHDTLKSSKSSVAKALGKKLNAVFAAHGVGKKVLKFSGKGQVLEAYRAGRDRGPWTPIKKDISAYVGGQAVTLKSSIVSGRHIETALTNPVRVDDQVLGGYEKGVNAYNSFSPTTANAVNIATSKLEIEDADGTTKPAFLGVRHGVNSAWGLKGADRSNANIARSFQCVHAALVSYLERHPDVRPNEVLNLPMTSVSLLTPDLYRSVAKMRSVGDERTMMEDQYQAWQTLNRLKEPLELTVKGRKYMVKPDIIMFNYGVNKFATGFLGSTETTAGWEAANDINLSNMRTLLARAERFVRTHPDHENLDAIGQLIRQLTDILRHGDERKENHDAYKVGSRILMLSYLMDGVPCWNCKSGKDRTGEMDVECKFLATLIARRQPIPEPGAHLSPEQRELFKTIALQGGNLELQQYNMGIGGNKVHGEKSVRQRIGGSAEAIAAFKGGASYVSTH